MALQKVCARPNCQNNLNTGIKYCGLSCAAQDRGRVKTIAKAVLPDDIVGLISDVAGSKASGVIDAVSSMAIELRENRDIVMINPSAISKETRTTGDWTMNWRGGEEWRPNDALSFDKIEAMDQSGIVQFAVRMVLAQIVAVFRDDSTVKIVCQDEELREVIEANFRLIIGKFIYDSMDNALRTGAGFSELVWRSCTKYELGLSKNRGGRKFTVLAQPKPVATDTIKHIRRTSKGRFNGFVQNANNPQQIKEVTVKLENAFIMTFNERNRNKWGRSLYEAIYPLWFWYQIILRSMVRYMERMGTPVTVVSAPASKIVRKPGTDTQIDAMELGLRIAANASKSSALVVPSDVDPNTKIPLWDIKYLTADERAQPFIDVLERMSVMILRAAFMADRSLTAGEVGAFNIGEIHEIANSIHNQMTVMLISFQINRNLMPRLVRFNRGVGGPPCRMETMVTDLRNQEKLTKLLSISGNIPSAQEATGRMNWVSMAEKAGVPVISQEEFDKMRKRQEEEALERQRKQIEMQTQAGVGSDNQVIKDGARKSAVEEAKDKTKTNGATSQQEAIGDFISLLKENDVVVPVMVKDGEIELFNPFRDRVGGFASGPDSPVPAEEQEETLSKITDLDEAQKRPKGG